jgi:phosphatidylglycerophosphate synthase
MNISNALTVSRIFMVPVIALLIIRDDLDPVRHRGSHLFGSHGHGLS